MRRQTIVSGAEPAHGAPIARISENQVRVGHLVVVKKVGEDCLELNAYALCDLDVLFHAEIDIPIRHAPENAGPSAV